MKESESKIVYCIYLELEPYLKEWVINDCGGTLPLRFPKLSIENIFLKSYLTKLPHNMLPDFPTSTSVAIALPYFKIKNPEYYNYLPKAAKHELKQCIRERFKMDLWMTLHKFGWIGKRRDKLIEAFMESRDIEVNDTNTNTILKIYQRQYKSYLENKRYSENKKKKSKKYS